ncbi:MAG: filamentous hemagglutinin N-terminal domain-containing protein [Gloeomargaritaceae cyanobacterium C42_A2020_066]|nr:filamentous hemagglutinin N-terminal domain-containing protein [Gloeomargaritaceae cyanobacterium C42_A2020_066]
MKTAMKNDWRPPITFRHWIPPIGAVISISCFWGGARSQVVPDATLPQNTIVNQIGSAFRIDGGTQVKQNLFHSFSQFSVPTNTTVLFNNAQSIRNILTRVTGGSASNIDGLIAANGTANLFLINPSGITFGPNARLQLGGSFLASTATGVLFDNGAVFSAINPNVSAPLLAVNVPIGLQMNRPAGRIEVKQFGLPGFEAGLGGLVVQEGRTLGLLGGDILLKGGYLEATSGRIEVGSVHEGLVGLDLTDMGYALDYRGLSDFRNVEITEGQSPGLGTIARVAGGGEGDIQVQGRNITLSGESALVGGLLSGQGPEGRQAGDIKLQATDRVSIDQGLVANIAGGGSLGRGGDIVIAADSVQVKGGGAILTSSLGASAAGAIEITARGIEVSGTSVSSQSRSAIVSLVGTGAAGNSGDVVLNTETLIVKDGAAISADINGAGQGGSVIINARQVQVSGTSKDEQFRSGIGSESGEQATGAGGDISISSEILLVTDGAAISTSKDGSAISGSVIIDADSVEVRGSSASGLFRSAITSEVGQEAKGNGGNILIKADLLKVADGALVSSATSGVGNAGFIALDARLIDISGISADGASRSGIGSEVVPGSVGNGGNILITTDTLSITGGAVISSSTFGEGDPGSIEVQARQLLISGTSTDGQFRSGLGSQIGEGAVGDGRASGVSIAADLISVTGGAVLSAGTLGRGDAGSVAIDARHVEIRGASADGQFSSGIGSEVGNQATGNGGSILIKTDSLSVLDSGAISVDTFGQGNAGSISVDAQDVEVRGTRGNGIRSFIGSDVNPGATGDGGSVRLEVDTLQILDGGLVSASTIGVGDAGSVFVNARLVEVSGTTVTELARSAIVSEVLEGAVGDGGDVTINSDTVKILKGGLLSASTISEGDAGSVVVNARVLEILGTSKSGNLRSGIGSEVGEEAIGSGGSIAITAEFLNVSSGGAISASTFGQGDAGSITVQARAVELSGQSTAGRLPSGIGSEASEEASGAGGSVTITTNTLRISDGAGISTESSSLAEAGSIFLNIGDLILLKNNALISTSAQSGQGGNITLSGQFLVGFGNSDILANSLGGPGGRIDITTTATFGMNVVTQVTDIESLRTNRTNDIAALSQLGPQFSGEVNINNLVADVGGRLLTNDPEVADVSGLISPVCSSQARSQASLVITGRGGLPPNPDDLNESSSFPVPVSPEGTPQPTSGRGLPVVSAELPAPATHLISTPEGKVRLIAADTRSGPSLAPFLKPCSPTLQERQL